MPDAYSGHPIYSITENILNDPNTRLAPLIWTRSGSVHLNEMIQGK